MHHIRNVAEDLEVNCYLDRSKVEKNAGGVWVEDLGFDKCLGAKEYFRLLLQMAQQQSAQAKKAVKLCNGGKGGKNTDNSQQNSNSQQQPQQSSDCGSNEQQGDEEQQSGSGNDSGNNNDDIPEDFLNQYESFDDHSMWPEENLEQIQQVVEDMLIFAAEEVEKGRGTIPGELAGRIELIRNRKKPKPVADWKRYVRRYLGNEFSELIRKSKKRESRRFPDAAGNRHKRKAHMLVAIDTSGSVSMPEYREFFGQIKTLLPVATFHVVECDAAIQHEYDFNGKYNEILHGGGGTDFSPVINLFKKEQKKYEALVYFTDGYCDIPKDTPKETLWVVSSNGDQSSKKKYQVNGASVAFIPKQEQ